MIGIDWTPDEPVPITATRLPVKSTPSCGQRVVEYTSPRKRSTPSMSGIFGSDRQPVAITKKRQRISSPRSVRIRQREASSSQAAFSTRVEKRMSRRRSCLSATCCR